MPEALLNLGRILESSGKSEEARTCWSKALEAEPALAQGYFGPTIDKHPPSVRQSSSA